MVINVGTESRVTTRKFVSVDPEKCIGCGLCEYVCTLEKEGFPNPLASRIRVIRVFPLMNVAMTCRFCEDAPCVTACPRNALKQSFDNGVILVDEKRCDACGWCIEACPYGGITLHPEKHVVVACDLCGGNPKCVEFCPEEALELVSDDASARNIWVSALARITPKIERLLTLIKDGRYGDIFLEAEDKTRRMEEKLISLNETEIRAKRGS